MAALTVAVTSDKTARVSGSGNEDIELSAADEKALFRAIEDFAKTEATETGESVEVSVSGFGATKQLTVTPDGHVAVAGPPTGPIAPVAVPAPARPVQEPVSVRAAEFAPRSAPLRIPAQERHSVLVAPVAVPGAEEPARMGIRGRLNAVLNLRLAPKPESAEVRQRAAAAKIAGHIPGFSIVTVANPKGGVGKTPLSIALNETIAKHRGAGSSVCVDFAEVGGTLPGRVSIPPREGQDVHSLVAADAAAQGNLSPVALSRYLARQPGGDDIVAGSSGAGGVGFSYHDAEAIGRIMSAHREILIADTPGNATLSGGWQWATANAHALIVPVPMRHDTAEPGHKMLTDLAATYGPEILARTIVVITDGPGDDPKVESSAVEAFRELHVHEVARMPYEPKFASGGRIAASQLLPATATALSVLAAMVVDLIAQPTN